MYIVLHKVCVHIVLHEVCVYIVLHKVCVHIVLHEVCVYIVLHKVCVYIVLYPGVGGNYGWIKGKCADICDVAQVTDIRTLPN